MPETILLSIAVLLAALALSLALNGLFVKYGRKDREPVTCLMLWVATTISSKARPHGFLSIGSL